MSEKVLLLLVWSDVVCLSVKGEKGSFAVYCRLVGAAGLDLYALYLLFS